MQTVNSAADVVNRPSNCWHRHMNINNTERSFVLESKARPVFSEAPCCCCCCCLPSFKYALIHSLLKKKRWVIFFFLSPKHYKNNIVWYCPLFSQHRLKKNRLYKSSTGWGSRGVWRRRRRKGRGGGFQGGKTEMWRMLLSTVSKQLPQKVQSPANIHKFKRCFLEQKWVLYRWLVCNCIEQDANLR